MEGKKIRMGKDRLKKNQNGSVGYQITSRNKKRNNDNFRLTTKKIVHGKKTNKHTQHQIGTVFAEERRKTTE